MPRPENSPPPPAPYTGPIENRNPFAQNQSPDMMGEQYWKDQNQLAWADDATARYNREHSIDPRTGGITGPLGMIPHQIAQQWQAAHDQAVWNARNRMGLDALRMSQGAAGLLSSYRAGGASALYGNVHGQMANLQMQRANMMQPLDLLGDYRRELIHKAGSAGRSESMWGAGLQGLGAIASIAIPYVGPIVGAALSAGGAALGAQGQRKAGAAAAAAGGAGQAYGGGGGQQAGAFGGYAQQIGQGIGGLFSGAQQGATQPGTQPQQPGTGGAPIPGFREKELAGVGAQGQPAPQPQTPGGGEASAQGAPGDKKQVGAAGQQGMGMGMPGLVGQDGVFAPMNYAANGMSTSPSAPLVHKVLQQQMTERISEDPSWAIISMAWDRELALRTVGRQAA